MVLQRLIDNKHTEGKKIGRDLPTGIGSYTQKALANKIKTLKIFIQTAQKKSVV